MGLQKRQMLIQSVVGIGLIAATAATLPRLAQAGTPSVPTAKPTISPDMPSASPTMSPGPIASPAMSPEPMGSPEPTASPTASPEPTTTPQSMTGTIVDVAANNPDFSTLVTAVKAAGLDTTLAGEGPFTVFAPTNEAFAALPQGALEALLKPENKAMLQAILAYHVVPGAVVSADIKPGEVKTVQGKPVGISIADQKVMVNKAHVVMADVKAKNGVIHVIDKVLLPPDLRPQ